MKKLFAALAAAAVLTGFGVSAEAAITEADAVSIVRQNYPDAQIYFTKHDYDDGRHLFEVKFRTGEYRDCEMEIDANTGMIYEISLKRY